MAAEELRLAAQLAKPVRQSELQTRIIEALGLSAGEHQDAAPRMPAMPPMRCLRVLLAEDSLVNQKLAVGLLTKWGHQVVVAATARKPWRPANPISSTSC